MEQTESIAEAPAAAVASASLLISLTSLSSESLESVLANVATAFAGKAVVVGTPDRVDSAGSMGSTDSRTAGFMQVVGYTPSSPSVERWTLSAADYLNAFELMGRHGAQAVLVLGAEAQSLQVEDLRRLARCVEEEEADLAVSHYALPVRAGLVNSAILYPMSRALFGAKPRFPLAIDLGLSRRMAERMATLAQRFTAANQADALLWPVAEAAVAGYKIAEAEVGERALPQPTTPDLNSLLAVVAGSLFSDVDSKAAYWQRARMAGPATLTANAAGGLFSVDEAGPMIETFRLAYGNLHEIWSLVLPPQTLLGLKRMSTAPAAEFRMADSLWARIVFDFLLAFRLRTINRGHLLGALTPLYLAWVASHILQVGAGSDPERHIETVAAAFEADKAYLVSRWRWPDRFNP